MTGCLNSKESMQKTVPETIQVETRIDQTGKQTLTQKPEESPMKLTIGDRTLTAVLVENSTTEALKEMLAYGPVTIEMRDYGSMEKVGKITS